MVGQKSGVRGQGKEQRGKGIGLKAGIRKEERGKREGRVPGVRCRRSEDRCQIIYVH